MPARILIVDDHILMRTVIRSALLPHSDSLQICGEAGNGKEAIEEVQRLNPDIVLLDINMPDMNGLKVAEEIRRISPAAKIVFLTMLDTLSFVRAARMVSDGFVSKYKASTELIPTLLQFTGTSPDERIEVQYATD